MCLDWLYSIYWLVLSQFIFLRKIFPDSGLAKSSKLCFLIFKLHFFGEKWVIQVSYQHIVDEDQIDEEFWYGMPKNIEHTTKKEIDILLYMWNFVQNPFLKRLLSELTFARSISTLINWLV